MTISDLEALTPFEVMLLSCVTDNGPRAWGVYIYSTSDIAYGANYSYIGYYYTFNEVINFIRLYRSGSGFIYTPNGTTLNWALGG